MANKILASFPGLKTERLTLRQLSLDDQQSIFALRSDPAINEYLDRTPSKSLADAIIFIEKINDNIKNNDSIYWVISETATRKVVGTVCIFDFSSETKSCEIGYELMTSFQGQGIMQEAAEKVIDYAFQTLQFEKIVAFTHKENLKSIQLLKKIGFSESEEAENIETSICFEKKLEFTI